jgi:hypothetical protein
MRITIASVPDLRIQIRAIAAGVTPQSTFRVPDTAKAAQQLQALGLAARQEGNRVLVNDPDGNTFAFIAPRNR